MKLILKFYSLLFFIFILTGCERSVNLSFNDWDKDDDNKIDREEFVDVFTENYYDDWNNVDNEDYLDDEDFYSGIYRSWDKDENELLSRDEWKTGYDFYYGDYILINYDVLDSDQDNYIAYKEYYDKMKDSQLFQQWDVDQDEKVSQEELASGLFTVWDADDSGYLEKEEYEEFDDFYPDI